MSIDDALEKLKKFRELEVDRDVRVLQVAEELERDPREFYESLTEEQSEIVGVVGDAKVMVERVDPSLWWAYQELGAMKSQDIWRNGYEEMARAYAEMPEERREALKERDHISYTEGILIRVFGDWENTPFHVFNKRWYYGSRMPEPQYEKRFGEFMRQFAGLDDGVKDLTIDALKLNVFTEKIEHGHWETLQKYWEGNPNRFAAYRLHVNVVFSGGDTVLAQRAANSIDELTDDKRFCDHVVGLDPGDYKKWWNMYHRTDKPEMLFSIDKETMENLFEASHLVPGARRNEFYNAVKEVLETGNVQEWSKYVLDQLKKGKVGGGNYRTLFRGGHRE